jgi:pimeloyl-ACP methyl ester carboxylesterase
MASPTLPPAIEAERKTMRRRSGPLSYYVRDKGEPLLLIHSINAAASAFEVRPLAHGIHRRRIYAPDLPGFGHSDRSNRNYSIRLYTDAIIDVLDEIAEETGQRRVDAIALSLSCEFLARAAVENPERFRSLAFVTPTGFERGSSTRRGEPGGSREIPGLYKALTVPPWRRSLFNLLVSRPSIRFFLKKTFGSDRIDEALLDYDYITAHQPGAEHAPYAFVSGRLFSADIRNLYEALTLPICVFQAEKGDFKDFSEADWARARSNWEFHPLHTGALVQFEKPESMIQTYEAFLARHGDRMAAE